VDWVDAISKLGFPIVCAVAGGWVIYTLIKQIQKDGAVREAGLIAALTKERDFRDGKLVELIVNYAKDHDDTLEMNSRAETLLKDLLSRRASWPEKPS
jgi:hypothetical protein